MNAHRAVPTFYRSFDHSYVEKSIPDEQDQPPLSNSRNNDEESHLICIPCDMLDNPKKDSILSF
jgi:hypothetical protein